MHLNQQSTLSKLKSSLADAKVQRLVPLDTWLFENADVRVLWRSGSPHLVGPDGMGKWLRRHEARLAEHGVLMRLGHAWRIVEPGFVAVALDILAEERARATRNKGKCK